MTAWVAHASIHSTHRVDPEEMMHLRQTLGTAPGIVMVPVPGGVSVRLPVLADRFSDAYTAAVTVLATEILPGLEPARLTDLHIVAAGTRDLPTGRRASGA